MDDALACAYTVVMLSLHGIETGRMFTVHCSSPAHSSHCGYSFAGRLTTFYLHC